MLIEKGFEIDNIDANSFLKNCNEEFIGISALQVIEHLDYSYLKEMLQLSYQKIAMGGMIILETINPRNALGLANFYMDETHKRPLPAEMMVFLMEWYGFRNIKIVYSALLPDNYRNSEINNNYHDYAVIGYKI
jgi:O-antigen chain-terminating methyltransferase